MGLGTNRPQTSEETGAVPPKSTEVRGHREHGGWAMSEGIGLCSHLQLGRRMEYRVIPNHSFDVVDEKKDGCQAEQWVLK